MMGSAPVCLLCGGKKESKKKKLLSSFTILIFYRMEFLNQPSSTIPVEESSQGDPAPPSPPPPQKKPLVVRVKRKRNQESHDAICIEEHHHATKKRGMAGLAAGLNSLSHLDSTKILLTRIETISDDCSVTTVEDESSVTKTLDSNTYNALKRSRYVEKANEETDSCPAVIKKNRDAFKFIVTKNKKVFTSEDNSADSMIFVDMTSIESASLRQDKDCAPSAHASTSTSSVSPKKGKRVLDPLTRMLNTSINTALSTGIFTDMLAAIEQGADINYQRTDSDGYTCLMVAVQMSDLNVVSKLLRKNANALLQNEVTQTAVDIAEYAKLERRHHSASMILIMVRQTASEQFLQLQKSLGKGSGSGSGGSEDDDGSGGSGEYVYDIYTCHNPSSIPDSATDLSSASASTKDTQDNNMYDAVPNIKVSGLSLDDMGNAEIDFHYDSDWSDLAHDDDDEDSNDENYFGNDYPEDDEASNDGYERNFDNMLPASDEDEGNGDSADEEGGQLPRFDRNGIGRQLKPFVVDEHQSSFAKTSEEIENLWSLENRSGEEEGGGGMDMDPRGQQHATRLSDMGKRTGISVIEADVMLL